MLEFITHLREKAQELGFCDAGIADIVKTDMTAFRKWLASGYGADMKYLENNIGIREDPSLLLEGSKSIIMAAIRYPDHMESRDGLRYAGFASGKDYHHIIKSKLRELAQAVLPPGTEWRAFSDSAPILERHWAERCGLGIIGQNNFLISYSAGARVLLGTIVSTFSITKDIPETPPRPFGEEICDGCGLCVKACPNGALKGRGRLDASRCISYHTVESRSCIPDTIDTRNWIIGCEECLISCPFETIGNASEVDAAFMDNIRMLNDSDTRWWEIMDRSSFKKTFKGTAFERPGLEKMIDNIRHTASYTTRHDKDCHKRDDA